MDQFRTAYKAILATNLIDYSTPSLLIGSCFSNNISEHLSYRKFKVNSNPFGILFNPISIVKALSDILDQKVYTQDDLVKHNEIYHSMNHHSEFSNPNPQLVLEAVNNRIQEAYHQLNNASFLFITMGSAWVYEFEGKVVANCHKIPNTKFQKRLLSVDEIKSSFLKCILKIKESNPTLNIVFTLSPVRHLKDGFVENNLSKSILRTAIHELQQENLAYFPAYEIVQDDLRDYRFYGKDLVHPSGEAITYVWEQFVATYINPTCLEVMKRIENLQAAMQHRPRFPDSEAYQKHLAFIEKEKQSLQNYF